MKLASSKPYVGFCWTTTDVIAVQKIIPGLDTGQKIIETGCDL
jgi:hypothetical protein